MFTTLTRKVILVALTFLGIFVVAAVIASISIIIIREAAMHLSDTTLEQVELSGQFNTDMFRGFAEALSYARTHSADNRESALQEMSDAKVILDQLSTLETKSDPFIPQLASNHVQLQTRRSAAYGSIQPKIADLLRAADTNNTAAIGQALDMLNAHKNEIEQIEEESGTLADASIDAAKASVATRIQIAFVSIAIGFAFAIALVPLVLVLMRRWLIRPVTELADAASAVAQGDLARSVAVTNTDEIGTLQRAFNKMIDNLAARTTELQLALEESANARAQLNATVLALTSPVVPVLEGIIVMPLIGVIDDARADHLTRALLQATAQYQARTVILDVTGVPMIDTRIAHALLTAAEAVKLLGASPMLVGLRAELAQTIVGLKLDLTGLITKANLRSAIEEVVQRRGLGR